MAPGAPAGAPAAGGSGSGSGRDTVWVESALKPRFTLEPSAERWFVVRYY